VLARLLIDLPPSMTTPEERAALERSIERAERDAQGAS
jgi:hypothetical protein